MVPMLVLLGTHGAKLLCQAEVISPPSKQAATPPQLKTQQRKNDADLCQELIDDLLAF
jgi:hypothetical protein